MLTHLGPTSKPGLLLPFGGVNEPDYTLHAAPCKRNRKEAARCRHGRNNAENRRARQTEHKRAIILAAILASMPNF
jgi:hypothetical protein